MPWTVEPRNVETAAQTHNRNLPFGWFALPQQNYSLTVTSPTTLLIINGTYGYAMEAEARTTVIGEQNGEWQTRTWLLSQNIDLATLQLAYYIEKTEDQTGPIRTTVIPPPRNWADIPDEDPREMDPGTRVLALLLDEGRKTREYANLSTHLILQLNDTFPERQ